MIITDIITEGSVFASQVYNYRGINYSAVAIPFFAPGEGRGKERLYQRVECDGRDCHAVVSWVPGRGGLPYPNLEAFPDEVALFTAYPCLRGLLHKENAGWSLQACCTVYDVYQNWRDGTRPEVDLMPIELREKCCFLIRRHGWMRKPLYDHLNLPLGLLEFRPGVTAVLHVADTAMNLAFAHPEIRPALDRGLRQSLVVRLERKQMFPANFGDDHCLRDPQVTVLPLKGAGQHLLVQRRFPAGTGRSVFTLLAWTGDGVDSGGLCTGYTTLDALVREHPDLEAPLVKYHQDIAPVAGGGTA